MVLKARGEKKGTKWGKRKAGNDARVVFVNGWED